MAKKVGVRKTSKSTLVIYGIIILLIIFAFWFLGTSMDFALKPDGKVDMNLIGDGMNKVLNNPEILFSSLKNKNSYAPKMLFLGACSTGIYVLYKYTEDKKRLHRRGVEHGSAKWGDEKEMKLLAENKKKPHLQPIISDGKRVFDKKGNFVGVTIDNNIVLTKEVRLSLNSRQHLLNLNVLIIGGSGSGKTRFYAKPNIMQLNTSYVITDPKGEILQSTGKMLKEAGYEVRVLNLIQMEHSNNYNPFHYVYDYNGDLSQDNIKKMVNVLFKSTKGDGEKDDFWSQKGQSLLEAITFLLFEESEYNAKFDDNGKIIPETRDTSHLNFFSVTEKMRRLQYPPSGGKKPDGFFLEKNSDESEEDFRKRQSEAFLCPLDKDFIELEKRKGDTLAGRLYKEVRNAPEETGQSFLSSANVKTFMFNMDNMMNLTCCDNIRLETMGDRKTALFLIIPATDSTYNFLVAMLYTQMFDVLANRANFKYRGTLPVHVRCIMDEFANIGQIPDFDKVIAFVRSMGMSLNVIIQNLAQLKARYEKTWEVITGNCDSLLFLGGQEESTLKYISEALGKETIDIRGYNRTKGKSPSTSENNSILGRELMQPNEVATMPISDCIVRIRSHNPFYCTKYPIEKHPNFKFLEDYDKKNAFDVKTVHAVTLQEFTEKNTKKAPVEITDLNTENQEQEKKIETIFSKSEVPEIDFETYEEAELYADELVSEDFSEEYIDDSPEFGEVSGLESFELGEPVRPREEVNEDDEVSTMSEESDIDNTVFYEDPDECAESFEDIAEIADEAIMDCEESYSEDYSDYELPEDDYGMSDEMFDFD
ncbi:MAG: type IV secretory system conjugative DNA transfer family protein [Ruminococcus sp.]|nr:type IV secretory system conjugative DNA transfer family protein [Ruminococcus sp.]